MDNNSRKRNRSIPVIAAVAAIAAVIATAAFALYYSGFNFGVFGALRGEKAGEYLYENTSRISKSALGSGFAVLTGTEVSAFNEKGEETYLSFIVFDEPVLNVCGSYAVAYDEGGSEFIVFTERGESYREKTEHPIISVFVNGEGYTAAAAEEPGYGGSVTVYNPSGRELFRWYSGSNYVVSGKVRERGELMTLTVGRSGSDLRLFRIDDEAEQGSFGFEGIIIDAGFNAAGVTVVTSEKLYTLNRSLSLRGEYDFSGKHLEGYEISDSFTLLVLNDYTVGGSRELVLVDANGTQSGSIVLPNVEGWAISGRTVAVAAGGRITFYNARFESSYSASYTGTCDRLCLRDENTAVICGDYSAKVVWATGREEKR